MPSDPVAGAVRLVPLTAEHLPAATAMMTDPDVLRFTRVPEPMPASFPGSWFRSYQDGRRDGTKEAFAIVDGDAFLGIAVAPRIDRDAKTVELGYTVVPEARGRGVASSALDLLTSWGFDELGARRIELYISVDNVASKRVAEHCGYVYEGTLRGMHFKQDIWEDSEIWSHLPTDP
jgi:RimJ/RimL family protein N-acetyltransferase